VSSSRNLLHRLRNHIPAGQFLRYLYVGIFNTVFGYCIFATALFCFNHVVPQRYLYLTVILASAVSTPLNITVAWLGYKFVVFRTRGNYLREWIKCFSVYGVGMLPGLFALSVVTRLLQSVFNAHQGAWQSLLVTLEFHLHGHVPGLLERLHSTKALAGYVAGALVMGFTTIFSFIGHRQVTFRQKRTIETPS
jgi:putative flippase GtrA